MLSNVSSTSWSNRTDAFLKGANNRGLDEVPTPMRSNDVAARTCIAAVFVVLLAACGGGENVSTTTDQSSAPTVAQVADTPLADEIDGGQVATTRPAVAEAPSTAESTESPEPTLPPEEAAAANQPLLQGSDDARDIEVLSVVDGSISTLRDAVAGDRPVLLWFWAPH